MPTTTASSGGNKHGGENGTADQLNAGWQEHDEQIANQQHEIDVLKVLIGKLSMELQAIKDVLKSK